MQNILITICARGGSKGIPGKNIRTLNGKPLIAYSIDHANQFKNWIEKNQYGRVDIILSTDSNEIKDISAQFGLTTDYLRPEYLANDKAGKLDAIKDVLLYAEKNKHKMYDLLLDLDVSAPLRTKVDLQNAFIELSENKDALNLFSVSPANKNPYFNMVEAREDGFYGLSKKSAQVLSRQSAPAVYEMNASFYFYKRAFYDKEFLSLFDRALIYNMPHESFDLDHLVDFEFLEFLLSQDKLSFEI